MAEFQAVLRQWCRMCEQNLCESCPGGPKEGIDSICLLMRSNGCQPRTEAEVEGIIMQWAAEHPEPVYPTWAEYLYHRYHNLSYARILGETIPADIASKLGIQPKEAKE